jgi:hypothetical protein
VPPMRFSPSYPDSSQAISSGAGVAAASASIGSRYRSQAPSSVVVSPPVTSTATTLREQAKFGDRAADFAARGR